MRCPAGADCGRQACAQAAGGTVVTTTRGVATFEALQVFAPVATYSLSFALASVTDESQYDGTGSAHACSTDVVHVLSSDFEVRPAARALRVLPASWDECAPLATEAECVRLCKWRASTQSCVGLEDSAAESVLRSQPSVRLLDDNNNPVSISNLSKVRVSLEEGFESISGDELQSVLAGTKVVSVSEGGAVFTDLAIMMEGQGFRLVFELLEQCCGDEGSAELRPTGVTAISSTIAIFGKVSQLVVTQQPQNGTVGSSNTTLTVVEIRDAYNYLALADGYVDVSILGSRSPRCPTRSRTLPIDPHDVGKVFERYARAGGNSGLMTLEQFSKMMSEQLSVQASSAEIAFVFASMDVEGVIDEEGIQNADGFISLTEFQVATSKCVCIVGYAAGTFKLEVDDGSRIGEITILESEGCEPKVRCKEGHLGKECRQANSMISPSLERLPVLFGTTRVNVVDGVAVFPDLYVIEAREDLSFRFESSHGASAVSDVFLMMPTAAVSVVFLDPALSQAQRAGIPIDIQIAAIDKYDNFDPSSTAKISLVHLNVSGYSLKCNESEQILPCDRCPDATGVGGVCPGLRCPFRCDYENAIRNTSQLDPTPWGQPCAYRCKQGCTFMCGTIRNQSLEDGYLAISDVQIKRVGSHSLQCTIDGISSNSSAEIDWGYQWAFQKRVLGRLIMIENTQENKLTATFMVVPSQPRFLVSDFGPLQEQTQNDHTRAGVEVLPHPVCLVTDLYGNTVELSGRKVGLLIRDSDRDEFDVPAAVDKYVTGPTAESMDTSSGVVGYPPGSGLSLGEDTYLQFSVPPFQALTTADDSEGCRPFGQPPQGCPPRGFDDDSLLLQDQVTSPEWCPSTQEKRFCRSCLTAERLFEFHNTTHWKQTIEYVNNSATGPQVRSEGRCPPRMTMCDEVKCFCLIELKDVRRNVSHDVCEACTTSSMPQGLPIAETDHGRATFSNIFCSKPRSGYRFQCVSPDGRHDGTTQQVSLVSVSWDVPFVRRPPIAFHHDQAWGRFNPTRTQRWIDSSGNAHPMEAECTQLCVNDTARVVDTGNGFTAALYFPLPTCPSFCFKYGFPTFHNPIFNFVPPESPGLSLPFRVGPGDVFRLIIRFPKFNSVVQAIEASGANEDTSFVRGCTEELGLAGFSNVTCPNGDPQAFMLDKFNNTNKTSSGVMQVALIPGQRNQGTQMVGKLTSPVLQGQGLFPVLQIACPGKGFRLEFSYTGDAGLTVSEISDAFDVMPAPPRLQSVVFDPTFTHLYFKFTKSTDRARMPLQSDCLDVIGGLGYRHLGESLYDATCSQFNVTNTSEYVIANATNSTPALYGTRFIVSGMERCELSSLIGDPDGDFPPVCSWRDDRTLVLRLGRSRPGNPMIRPFDSVFLRAREDGLQLRAPADPLGTFAASLPADRDTLQGPICAGDTCGGHSVISSTSLAEVEWSCFNANPDVQDLCTPGVFGFETQDMAFFEVRSVEYVAVASFCAGSISALSGIATCISQGSERAVVVYRVMMSEEAIPKPGLYEYQILEAQGPVDLLTYTIATDFTAAPVLLAVVQYYDGMSFGLEVTIYEWSDSQEFSKIQSIPTDGARSVTTAEYGNQHYLFIAQENRDAVIMVWRTGSFVSVAGSDTLIWQAGAYVDFIAIPKAGSSTVKQWTIGDDWFVGFANFKVPDEQCSGLNLTCGEFEGSVDIYKIGFHTRIAEFIPYPCNRNQDTCIQDEWCLTRKYANITLENPTEEVLNQLLPGSFVLLDDEIMQVVDLEISEGELFSLQRTDIQAAWMSMQEVDGDVLSLPLKELMQRPAGWFRVPAPYREAWAFDSGDKSRLSRFFGIAESITGRVSFKPTSPTAVDLDHDGLHDLVVGTRDGSLRFLRNLGAGAFDEMEHASPAHARSGHSAPAFTDLNGDGFADLVLGAADGSLRSFRRVVAGSEMQCRNQTSCSSELNLTNATTLLDGLQYDPMLAAEDPVMSISVSAYSKPAFADMNGDSLVDLLLGAEDGSVLLYVNNGTAATPMFTYAEPSMLLAAAVDRPHSSPAAWDIDGDGDVDVVVGSLDGSLRLLERTGPGLAEFTMHAPGSASGLSMESLGERSSPAFFDLNGFGNETAMVLGHTLGDSAIYKLESAEWQELTDGSVLADDAVTDLFRSDFYKVFTGFDCMRGVCTDCSSASPLRCQNDNCNGILSDFTRTGALTSDCITYIEAEPQYTYDTCCMQGVHGSYRPCRRFGHITVERAMRDTLAAEPGTCIFEEQLGAGLINIVACGGREGCICNGGSADGQDCVDARDCQAHLPGTLLYVVPEDVLAANDDLPILSLPTLGTKDFVHLEIGDRNMVVVANHFSGCGGRGFNLDSVVYTVDYKARVFNLQQSFSTSGASGLLTFTREEQTLSGETELNHYLLVANYRDQYDLTTVSALYQWVQPATQTCTNESVNCTQDSMSNTSNLSSSAAFVLKENIMTDGAVRWIQVNSDILGDDRFFVVSSATGRSVYTSSPAYSFIANLPRPVVLIDAPQNWGPGVTLHLDARRSRGFLGREVERIEWRLLSAPENAPTWLFNATANLCTLVIEFPGPAPPNVSHSDLAVPDGTYRFELALENWVGGSATGRVEVIRVSASVPWIDIAGMPTQVFTTDQFSLTLGGNLSQGKDLAFSWTVDPPLIDLTQATNNPYLGSTTASKAVSLDQGRLSISPYLLTAGQRYTVAITAQSDLGTISASKQLQVGHLPPLAFITGGDRTIGLGAKPQDENETVSIRYPIRATKSRNQNYQAGSSVAETSIFYSWSCSWRESINSLGVTDCPRGWYITVGNVVTLFLDRMPRVETTIVFTIRVEPLSWECVASSSLFAGVQPPSACPINESLPVSEAHVQLTTVLDDIPQANLTVLTPHTLENEQGGGLELQKTVAVVNEDAVIAIQVEVEVENGTEITSITWRLEDEPSITCNSAEDWCHVSRLASAKSVVAPGVVRDAVSDARCGIACTSSLVIQANTFKGYGVYTFVARVTDTNGTSAETKVSLKVDHPPVNGAVSISPQNGTALDTSFEVLAAGWFDPESPRSELMYSFSLRRAGCAEVACELPLRAKSVYNTASFHLPPGSISVVAHISDRRDGTRISVLHEPVEVGLPSPDALAQYVNQHLQVVASEMVLPALLAAVVAASETLDGMRADALDLDTAAPLRNALIERLVASAPPLPDLADVTAIATALELLARAPEETSQENRARLLDLGKRLASSVLGVFRAREAALPAWPERLREDGNDIAPNLPEADALAPVLAALFSSLFQPSAPPYAPARRSASLQESVASVLAELLASEPEDHHAAEDDGGARPLPQRGVLRAERRALAADREAELARIYSVLEAIEQASALSVANAYPDQRPATVSTASYALSTARLENAALPGHAETWGVSDGGAYQEAVACLTTPNVSRCCAETGSCCFEQGCDAPVWRALPPSGASIAPGAVVLPTKIEGLTARAYEFVQGTVFGNAFETVSARPQLIDTTILGVRPFHGEDSVPELLSREEEAILRLPIPLEAALFLADKDVTTPTQQGVVAACVSWDTAIDDWTNEGIRQESGAAATKRMCIKDAGNSSSCFRFVECFADHLGYFSATELAIDCRGQPRGPARYDLCDVCEGDNSTCSGCDNLPNSIRDGILLDKNCSGHGACGGGDQCKCCFNESFLVLDAGAASSGACPWYGVMCHRYCTRSPSDLAPPEAIHCNGHGFCHSSGQRCECDPDWLSSEEGPCTVLSTAEGSNNFWQLLLLIVAPLLALVCLALLFLRYRVMLKRKEIDEKKGEIADLVLNELPQPVLEEVGDDILQPAIPAATPDAKGLLRPSDRVKQQKKEEELATKNLERDVIHFDPSKIVTRAERNNITFVHGQEGLLGTIGSEAREQEERKAIGQLEAAQARLEGEDEPNLEGLLEGERRDALVKAATRWPLSHRMPAPEMAGDMQVAAALGHVELPPQRKAQVKAQFDAQRRESSRKMPEAVKEQNRINISKWTAGPANAGGAKKGTDGSGRLIPREATPSPSARSPVPPAEDDDHGLVLMDEDNDVVAQV